MFICQSVFLFVNIFDYLLVRKKRKRQHRFFIPFNLTAVENDIAILKVRQTTLPANDDYIKSTCLCTRCNIEGKTDNTNDDYIKRICMHQVNSSGSEVCKERVIWPACLPRSEILSDMAYIILSDMVFIRLSDCQIWHLLDYEIVRYGIS